MYEFNYHKATSVADAAARLAAAADAKLMAGGQTLIAALKLRLASPTDVIDLRGVAEAFDRDPRNRRAERRRRCRHHRLRRRAGSR